MSNVTPLTAARRTTALPGRQPQPMPDHRALRDDAW